MGIVSGERRQLQLLLWGLPLAGFLVILVAFYLKATPLAVAQPHNNQDAGEIQGAFTVGQSFYSPYPGLYRIDVMLATYARPNSGQVTFSLTPGAGNKTRLATVQFDASQVKDNRLRSFEFPALDDSAGKTYAFYLEAPASRPGNAITAWTDSTNPYSEGMAYFGGRAVEGDLNFAAHFRPNPWQLAGIYLDRMARGKPGIWGSTAFYVVVVTVYLTAVGVFLAVLFRAALREGMR